MRLLRFLGFSAGTALAVVAATVSCSDDTASVPLACLDAGVDPATCTPAYPPTYDALITNTFRPSCATDACHGGATPQGGLSFDDPGAAYAKLLRDDVTPKEPSCSDLVLRVTDPSSTYRMPPTRQLDAGEQCAIAQWVANGAPR